MWGLLFYGLVVALRLGYAATGQDRIRLASFALSAVGVLYAGYLVFVQAAEIGAFCALCMTSHALTLVLFVLHALEHRGVSAPAEDSPRRRAPAAARGLSALRPYAPALGVFAVLLAADVALAGQADAAPDATPTPNLSGAAAGAAAGAADPNPTALTGAVPAATGPSAACQFDPNIDPIADLSPFTSGPFTGSADPDAVTVVEIFDPNCPHCRDLAEALEPVKAALAGEARFYTVAYPLRQQSVAQVIALNEAQRAGTYQALVDEMFRRQDATWGMSMPELQTALNAVGMDGAAFDAKLQNTATLQPLLEQVQRNAEAVAAAFASRDGGISTPRVAVGNRVILGSNEAFTEECFRQFVAEARGQ